MTAKEYLRSKGIFSLDTKKRTEEVYQWMEEYANQKALHIAGRAVGEEIKNQENFYVREPIFAMKAVLSRIKTLIEE